MTERPGVAEESFDAVFLVETPLQALNAAEARHHYEFRSPVLVLLTSPGFPENLLRSLIDPADWASIRVFPIKAERPERRLPSVLAPLSGFYTEKRWVLERWAQRRSFDALFRPLRAIAAVVIGNYFQEYARHLANLCPGARVILIDDGTDTLRIAEDRLDPKPETEDSPGSAIEAVKSWFSSRLVAWNDEPRAEVEFFSAYQVAVPPSDKLTLNTYDRVRLRAADQGTDRRCMFLGQPLVEDGYMTPDVFAGLMAGVRRSAEGLDMVYLPHPREDRAELTRALSAVGIELAEIGRPFEFYLLEQETLPAMVASFFTSALPNCRLIWGDAMRLVAFEIRADQLIEAQDFVADIYRYFREDPSVRLEMVVPGAPLGG